MSSNKGDIFPLLTLPRELRNEIYYFAILGPTPNSAVSKSYQPKCSHYHRIDMLHPLPQAYKTLSLVCRQTREEAQHLFFNHPHTLFKYDFSMNMISYSLPLSTAPFFSLIQKLEISTYMTFVDYHNVYDEDFDHSAKTHPKSSSIDIQPTLDALPQLKLLRLDFTIGLEDFMPFEDHSDWIAWHVAKQVKRVIDRVGQFVVRIQLPYDAQYHDFEKPMLYKRNLGETIERSRLPLWSGSREIVLEQGTTTLNLPHSKDQSSSMMKSMIIRRGIGRNTGFGPHDNRADAETGISKTTTDLKARQKHRVEQLEEEALEIRTYGVQRKASSMSTAIQHSGATLSKEEGQAEWERQCRIWPGW